MQPCRTFSVVQLRQHYPIFVDFVANILSAFEAEVWLMTSVLKQKASYLRGDSQWLLVALPDEIVEMRRYWQNLFGARQGAVRVKEMVTELKVH